MNYKLYRNGAYVRSGTFVPDMEEREKELIRLYPDFTDQRWEGFGGAVTDSAGYVFSRMSERSRRALLEAYFGKNSLGYRLIRVPIDSCDFSLEQYEASPDGDPAHFDMERPLRYILPMLEAIRARNPEIRLMLSPWSPPKVFKTNGQRHGGGRLRPECYGAWAAYICRYIREFEDRGFPVACISLQNEPHAVQTWDSCLWSAAEERSFLLEHMRPALHAHGYDRIAVYVWDHNKERILDRALALFAGEGADAADGVAFHWYSGDHFDALRQVHMLFPEKKLLLSENCFEYRYYDEASLRRAPGIVAHEILGDLENGATGFLDWNLVLDTQGGPNYTGNFCCAPFLYDEGTDRLETQGVYTALWHFARFLPAGAKRILSSTFSDTVEKTAFARPDGSIVVILRNAGQAKTVYLSLGSEITALELPADALTTVEIASGNCESER